MNAGGSRDQVSSTRDFDDAVNASDDVLVDAITADLRVVAMNAEQREFLGVDPAAALLSIQDLYEVPSCQILQDIFERQPPAGFQSTVELSLIGRGGCTVATIARCTMMESVHGNILRVSKIPLGLLHDEKIELALENLMLRRIIEHAREGHWCIEFLEPVDIRCGRAEIIAQVFENASVWRLTNRAVERIYDLPEGTGIAPGDVRLYWPRTERNEQFVGQIVDCGFYIDRAISQDLRADGTLIFCENDVRADIEDGFVTRIWGNLSELDSAFELAPDDLVENGNG